jgi:origin recognition complex subunit 5
VDNIDSSSELRYAIVKSAECITGRHLLETIVGEIARAVDWKESVGRCESLAQLAVEVRRLLNSQWKRGEAEEWDQRVKVDRKFVLVLDGVDKQKEAQPTLLSALARLGELVSDSITFNFMLYCGLCETLYFVPKVLTLLDTQSHNHLYRHFSPPVPPLHNWRAAYPLPSLHEIRSPPDPVS